MNAPITDTHIEFIRYAQEQYQEAINKQNAEWANFWLGHLHKLCQQVYWLESAANMYAPPQMSMSLSEEQKQQILKLQNAAVGAGTIVSVPPPSKPKPTSYNWDDGFEGVKMSNAWDDEEEA